jgi:hypothetical protein
MALANYTDLQSEIALYLARSDLTAIIPDFIKLSEAKLQRRFKDVTPLSAGNNWLFTASPDVYLYGALLEAQPYLQDDARIATWAKIFEQVVSEVRHPDAGSNFANYTGLKLAIADWLARPDIDSNIPNFIELIEAKFQRKFKGVTSLSNTVTTNWLLTAHPDVYLYGSLLQAEPYLKDDARIQIWEQAVERLLAEVRLPDTESNFNNYTGLQASVADWLNRPDLTNAIPNFIQLAEAQFQRKFLDVTSLSASVDTNWLLTNHPDIYLYGTLLEAAPYLKDDARVALWQNEYDRRIVSVRNPTSSGGFTTYTTLQATIADWLNRPDLANVIPTFISLAEKRLSRDLRIRQMLKVVTTTLAAADKTVELPSDYLQMRDLHINTNPIQVLEYQSPSNFYRNTNSTISGVPFQYTVLAQEFQFAPVPDGDYTLQMIYYAAPPALSSFNASNMFLANCPDLLLYGALSEAEPYLMNDPRIQVWASLYDRALSALTISDDQGEYGGSPLSISIATR